MAPLAVIMRPAESLVVDSRNARIHSPKQIRQIARSIAAFGMNVPILIDEAGKVIAGHGRLLACQELGLPSVPTICLSHLSEAEKRAFALAENRLVENGGWDEKKLAEAFQALTLLDLDFALDVTGFEVEEIDLCLQKDNGEQHGTELDDVLPVSPGPAVSRRGDLWLLGDHRLLCGDALDAANYDYSAHLNVCVWAKTNGGLGSMYRSAHEFVHVYKVGTAPYQNHIQLGAYGRYRTNVWVAGGASSGARDEDGTTLLDLHPTVKPTALIADILLDASSRRDIVLDVFAGSGTTILAAERVGRIAYAMDIDPLYVDVAVRRFQRLTGRSAVHADLQCTFDELEEQRIGGGHA